jgi:hypothetical protein
MYMKSLASLLRIVTMALLLAAPVLSHADDSLPPPQDGTEEEVPFNPPQDNADEPLPTMGDDALPDPSMNGESSDNVVNTENPSDDIFLPAPQASGESADYTPLTTSTAPAVSVEENGDWRYGWNKRPIFTAHAGMGIFNYPVTNVKENIPGANLGVSVRVFSLGQTVFLHGYASYSWVNVGGVGPFFEVKDSVTHIGAMLEIGIGRRLSLFGAILNCNHTLRSSNDASGEFGNVNNYAPTLASEGWKPGVGLQYDFYVVPHGSLGLRAYVEQDMSLLALTMSVEPAPRKKLSLNFNEAP